MATFITRPELAQRWRVSLRTVDALTKDGQVPHLRFGSRVMYPIAALEQFETEQAFARLSTPATQTAAAPRRRPRRSPRPPHRRRSMSRPRRGRRVAPRRPAQHAASHATRPGKVARKPIRLDLRNELHGRVIDYISGDDRAWFDAHPGEHFRYRPAAVHEWCDPRHAPDCVPTIDVPAWVDLWVEVQQIVPGARIRRPYLAPRAEP